jgi:hypothetical protein
MGSLDTSKGSRFVTTLSENLTAIKFENGELDTEIQWSIIQPGGGTYTLPAIAAWTDGAGVQTYLAGGAAPDSIVAGARHVLRFYHNGTRWIEGPRATGVRAAP